MTQVGQMGKLRLPQRRQATSARRATRPCPVERGLEMLWKLLESIQGDEMLVTLFPATVLLCLERLAVLSLQILSPRGKSQEQKALWVWLESCPLGGISGESLERATPGI